MKIIVMCRSEQCDKTCSKNQNLIECTRRYRKGFPHGCIGAFCRGFPDPVSDVAIQENEYGSAIHITHHPERAVEITI